jgi:hypothetical protein
MRPPRQLGESAFDLSVKNLGGIDEITSTLKPQDTPLKLLLRQRVDNDRTHE